MEFIAISGKGRSGKDTLGSALKQVGWTRVALADRLKQMGRDYFFITLENNIVDKSEADRRLLQDLGTMARRLWREHLDRFPKEAERFESEGYRFVRDLWILHLQQTIRSTGSERIFCPDLRYPHEAAFIKEIGGTLIRVDRPIGSLEGDAALHDSEIALDHYGGWDYRLFNDSTYEDYQKLCRFLSEKTPSPKETPLVLSAGAFAMQTLFLGDAHAEK